MLLLSAAYNRVYKINQRVQRQQWPQCEHVGMQQSNLRNAYCQTLICNVFPSPSLSISLVRSLISGQGQRLPSGAARRRRVEPSSVAAR